LNKYREFVSKFELIIIQTTCHRYLSNETTN